MGLPVRVRAHLVLQRRPFGLGGRVEVIGAARLRLRLDELVTRAPRGSDALVRPSDVARACGFDTEAAQKLTPRLKVGPGAWRKAKYRHIDKSSSSGQTFDRRPGRCEQSF